MHKKFRIHMFIPAILLLFFMTAIPYDTAHAEIEDGTYEIEYEMKEADNDNTSIADGYFTSPATLMVEDGKQQVQFTVTTTSMIESLRAPDGPVDIMSEDEEEETKTVQFTVDGDLSEPIELEMHVIVPDLYDMEHMARADFDVDGMEKTDASEFNEEEALDTWSEPDDGQDDTSEDTDEEADNTATNDADNENDVEVSGDANGDTDTAGNSAAADSSQDDGGTSNALWITLTTVGILIVAGLIFLMFRKKRST